MCYKVFLEVKYFISKYILNAFAWGKKSGKELFFKLFFCFHRLREHVADKSKLPILIFPEGKKLSCSLSPFSVDVIPFLFSWLLVLKCILTSGLDFISIFLFFIFNMRVREDNTVLGLDVGSPGRICRLKNVKNLYFTLWISIHCSTDLTSALCFLFHLCPGFVQGVSHDTNKESNWGEMLNLDWKGMHLLLSECKTDVLVLLLKCVGLCEVMAQFLFWTGTCINNTSVMMFKKGSFEIGGTIYPVAIKVSGNSWLLNFQVWGLLSRQ